MVLSDGEPGFVLHVRQYRERSLLVDLLCLHHGRISAVAHPSAKNGAVRRGLLMPFVPLLLGLRRSRSSLWTLSEAGMSGQAFAFSLPGMLCASYLNELLYRLLKEAETEPAPTLFAGYMQALRELQGQTAAGSGGAALRHFETILFRTLGYEISYRQPDGSSFAAGSLYYFSTDEGFRPVGTMQPAGREQSDLRSLVFDGALLNDLGQGHDATARAQTALRRIHAALLNRLLEGRPLKSRELYLDYLRRTGGN